MNDDEIISFKAIITDYSKNYLNYNVHFTVRKVAMGLLHQFD